MCFPAISERTSAEVYRERQGDIFNRLLSRLIAGVFAHLIARLQLRQLRCDLGAVSLKPLLFGLGERARDPSGLSLRHVCTLAKHLPLADGLEGVFVVLDFRAALAQGAGDGDYVEAGQVFQEAVAA